MSSSVVAAWVDRYVAAWNSNDPQHIGSCLAPMQRYLYCALSRTVRTGCHRARMDRA